MTTALAPVIRRRMSPPLIAALLAAVGLAAGAAGALAAARLGAAEPWYRGHVPSARALLPAALAGAAIGLLAGLAAPPGTQAFTALLGWLLLALALIDLARFILPNALTFAVLALGAVTVALTRPDAWPHHALGAALGYAALWLIETAYRRLRGVDGLGRGDAKLLGALGAWVTWTGLPLILLIASLSGLAAALISALMNRQPLTATTALAFGPWLALGGWIVWIADLAPRPLI